MKSSSTTSTAAELIAERADSEKPSMGLITWKNAPKGKILKSDVTVAKNYLIEREIKELERIVSMYLPVATSPARLQGRARSVVPARRAVPAQGMRGFDGVHPRASGTCLAPR